MDNNIIVITRNPMAYLDQMARDLMTCLWSHGRKANPFAGMWRSSAHWPTLTCSLPVLLTSWPPPARSRNRAHWKTSTSSSPLLWSHLVPWTGKPASSWPTSVGRFRVCLETTGKLRFCFNAFLFCYFVSILFCCTIVLSWTTARNISLSILS